MPPIVKLDQIFLKLPPINYFYYLAFELFVKFLRDKRRLWKTRRLDRRWREEYI